MKKIFNYIIITALALGATSCKKLLDINNNPNNPTTATPTLVLPQAIAASAALTNNYSANFSYPGGFFSNIYGVGGYGATINYNYTSANFGGLFSSSYDNANDYQFVLDNTSGDATLIYSTSIARIMKSFVFAKLVDQYNNVPYTDALKGFTVLTPKYDKAEDIYKDLVAQLNKAIADITTGQAAAASLAVPATADPMFGGDMKKWKVFANSLKLRLLVKMAGVSALQSFTTPEFAKFDQTIGTLATDALVNPGYVKQGGRLSPIYANLAANENDQRAQGQTVPTIYTFSFYNGEKIDDSGRGSVIFAGFPTSPKNQLGEENVGSGVVPPGTGSFYTGGTLGKTTPVFGVAKGYNQSQPVMLKAESDFVKAEAIARGYITGNAKTAFEAGIKASFKYLYTDQSGAAPTDGAVDALVATYMADNAGNDLVIYPSGLSQQIEAIITQKWIALAYINNDEDFAEYRRTGYPINSGSASDPVNSFASKQSIATSPDKVITRIPYPLTEYSLNSGNVPQNVNIFKDKIFWDVN